MQLTDPNSSSFGVVIINGGTQGLGEALARKLTADGAKGLVLSGRSTTRGKALAAELTDIGTRSVFVEADMSNADAPEKIVDTCVAEFGRIDGLANVAALTTRATLFSETSEHFDRMMQLNLKAPYFLIRAVAKHMIANSASGSIVNIGSTSSHGGQSKLGSYSISKGGLSIMTRNVAFALMRHGIRVNQVNPGWMETESEHYIQMEQDGMPENWLELAAPSRPLGRLVQPWEVANMIAYCLSSNSGLMTGNVIDIDQSVQGAGDPPQPSSDEVIWP